ncbi:uncharacterized protein TRAVEDRAFT_70479 [Trametes versicolor FP-101664 SS1]|uniref:uncharacterized protein n=1 Tax=Trametes versicolor (strain FP-101664) TaxID=717944 RepID=UPI0004622E66|nr:uncharacterized protein TRAVEDRAFT_70479 [Trametes versicolor FP-101664 SS1]EIW62399.1 hypothetical protein TRAVEDRAFT_70479 [Trametes versicolor FP-101664 SS1]
MNFDTTEHVLPGPPADGGLSLTFVRAVPHSLDAAEAEPSARPRPTVSLILLHSAASHKEVWFPTLEHLFDLQEQDTDHASPCVVVEAWAMDVPSHGRAAVLNEHILPQLADGSISGQQAARGVQVLLKSGLIKGNHVIGIGHSAGACVLIQSTAGYPRDALPYASIILAEPVILTPDVLDQILQGDSSLGKILEYTRTRRDIWPSRAVARAWLATRLPWSQWDARVLDLYVEHALRDLPTAVYPDEHEGVTLATTRAAELAAYTHYEDAYEAAEILPSLCDAGLPVHIVWATVKDRLPQPVHKCAASAAANSPVRMIWNVVEGGHQIVQENPDGVADAIWETLTHNAKSVYMNEQCEFVVDKLFPDLDSGDGE